METGNAGTWKYRRGADEHGCEFAPVASQSHIPSKFLVPLAALMLHSDSLNSTDITLLSPPNAFPGKLHSFLKIFPDKMCYTLGTNANHKEISMKQRFIALICIATLVFCGCGGKKQSSVQTDSGSEQPDATEESTEQSRNDPVTITFNSKTETYHADDLSTVLLYTSYQKPMVTIDGHPKISKTITQSLNEELDAFQDARLESLLSARISFAESPDSFSAYHLDEDFSCTRQDSRIISFESTRKEFTSEETHSAAYGGFNYDLENGETLSLSDIATDSNALINSALSFINQQLLLPNYNKISQLAKHDGSDVSSNLLEHVLRDGNWYFTKGGITFIANHGAITPSYSGTLLFSVPYQQLNALKAEYHYTGNFQLNALMGSAVSADMDGNGEMDAVYYDTTYNEETGMLSSTLTVDGTDYSEMLYDGNFTLSRSAASDITNEYYLIDLDTTDEYIELAIPDDGLRTTYFFRYAGFHLEYLGSIPDLIDSSTFQLNNVLSQLEESEN